MEFMEGNNVITLLSEEFEIKDLEEKRNML